MRNLKRALSLALASVMLLGMMVVGSSAVSYPDVDESKHNVEAIDVLNAVEVMIGDADTGNFRPDDKVSRNEMAVIMAKLVLGTYEADSYAGAHPFTDVPSWADRYVAACYTNGIIAGRSADTYDGGATVTAVEAAAMMLRALGYEDLSAGAAQWDQPVAAKANEVELFKGMSGNSKAEMSRDAVAQLSLNALQTTMVRTVRDGQNITLPDGTTIIGTRSYNEVTSSASWASAINDSVKSGSTDYYVELGEKLYDGKLTLNDSDDAFGRPCSEWEYKGRTVTAAEDYNVIFTSETSKGDVEKALKNYKIVTVNAADGVSKETKSMTDAAKTTADSIVTANGAAATKLDITTGRPATVGEAIANLTGDGKAVEIYANGSREITKIVVLTYGVATVNNITESKDGDYTKTNYTLSGGFKGGYAYTDPDKDSRVVLHGDVDRDDTVIVLELADETHIWLAEAMSGEQTSYNSGKNTITVDGKTYTVAVDMARSSVDMSDFETNTDSEATFYLDLYGNVVKSEAISSKDYAVIDSIRWAEDSNSLDKGKAIARLIFADGTTKDVTLNKMTAIGGTAQSFDEGNPAIEPSNKHLVHATTAKNDSVYFGLIVTYAEKSNGKYDLIVKSDSAAGNAADTAVVTKGVPAMNNNTISCNSKTLYIVRSVNGTDYEYDVYTGYENVPTIAVTNASDAKVSKVLNSKGIAEYVFISAPEDTVNTDASADLVYVFDHTDMSRDKDDNYVFESAALNGEAQTIKAENNAFTQDGLYEVKVDSDGVVTSATPITNGTPTKWVVGTADADAADGTIKVGGDSYNYLTADGKTYGVTTDDTISAVTGEYARQGYTVYLERKSTKDPKEKWQIDTMYIVEDENAAQVLPSNPSADDVNNTLESEGTAKLPSGGTLPSGTQVKDGQTIVLEGTSTVNNLDVKDGGTVEVNGKVTGTIKTEDGATVSVKEGVELPKIEGNGTVEVPSNGKLPNPDGTDYLTDLQAKIDIVEKTTGTQTPPASSGDKVNVDIAVTAGTKFTGGTVESYDGLHTMDEISAVTGGGAGIPVSLHKITIDKSLINVNDVIKIYYTTTTGSGAKTYTQIQEYSAPANTSTKIFGAGAGKTITQEWDSANDDISVILPLAETVTGIRIEVSRP